MSTLMQSFSMVAVAEIGDKTQLLSVLLAARFRKFWPIVAGILLATLANHGLVAWLGYGIGQALDLYWLNLASSVLFVAIGLWTLVPDDAPSTKEAVAYGAFLTSVVAFFIAEMGDKTQLATLTLAASHPDTWQVVLGTTLGMLAANIPAVLFGEVLLEKLPLRAIRIAACGMFVAYGAYGLWGSLEQG